MAVVIETSICSVALITHKEISDVRLADSIWSVSGEPVSYGDGILPCMLKFMLTLWEVALIG